MAKRFICDVLFVVESQMVLPNGDVYTIPAGTKVLAGTKLVAGAKDIRDWEEGRRDGLSEATSAS